MTTQPRKQDAPRPPKPEAENEGATELQQLRTEVAQLREALAHRPVIDQARGMIMVLGRCTADEAWTVLVTVSQHNNVKLRTVAEQLIATTSGRPLATPIRLAIGRVLRGRHHG
ncbi:ANTAR domain-containing response regulator [Streptomyces sp. NPDC057249]|uniref:ANTAR domain-containing response regulator n=1 Tax=Streptomyces sp. NPDC057249 TaxID=3346067 RepID=UPI0036345B47